MCTDCGCATNPGNVEIHAVNHHHHGGDRHHHHHHHSHSHTHESHTHESHTHDSHTHDKDPQHIAIGEAILAQNNRFAEQNRALFADRNLLALNLLSSPGSGKTTFIQRTIWDLRDRLKSAVIVGDLATDNDAQRLRQSTAEVVQITTGDVCHLEARSVGAALEQIDLDGVRLLFIENVGNLVCPAAYDLGEALRVALLSTTEGEDKPLKYPTLFKGADIAIVNKIDLAAAVEFDRELALQNITKVAPQAKIFEVSAKTGAGMADWYWALENHLDRSLATVAAGT